VFGKPGGRMPGSERLDGKTTMTHGAANLRGYSGLGLERVERSSGLGKAALYRRWSDKASMASDLLCGVGLTITD
jgi:AcrR family transcriptional regulator